LSIFKTLPSASEFQNFLSVDKKEACLKEVLKAFRGKLDSMEVQDMLLRHSWNTKKVIDYFKKKQVEPQTEKEETVESQQPVQQQQATAPQNYYPSPQETQQVYHPQQGNSGAYQTHSQANSNYFPPETYPVYQQSYPGYQEPQNYSYPPQPQYYNYNQPNYSYSQQNYSYDQQNFQYPGSGEVGYEQTNGTNHMTCNENAYPAQAVQNPPEVAQPTKSNPDSGTDDTPIKPKSSNKRRIPDTPDESERVNGFTNGNSNDSTSNSNSNSQQYPQKKKKARKNSSSDEDQAPQQPVFNSDEDSDYEYTEFMTKDKKEVHEFFNTATMNELTSIKSCSLRKAEVIVENRPYQNWHDLKLKFQTTKPLAPELLNNAQEYVNRRNSLKTIMKKCKNIVEKLQRAVEAGANITRQPSLLNPK
jgi:DNA uptake protein ComE-like DNA-binding protein